MTIFVNEGVDLNSTIKVVLLAVKESMDTDVLLDDNTPTVVRVTYLQGRPEEADDVGFVAIYAISISALALLLLLFWKQGRAVTIAETSRGLAGQGGVAVVGGDPFGSQGRAVTIAETSRGLAGQGVSQLSEVIPV